LAANGNAGEQQRVAVRLRIGHSGGADVGRGAGPVDDDEALAHGFAQPLDENARDQVGAAAGRERHHDLDRAAGILLRLRGREEQRGEEEKNASHRAAIANYCGAASGISARSE
jgi:hypothetical protein